MSDYMNPGDPFGFGKHLNELAKPVPVVPKKTKRASGGVGLDISDYATTKPKKLYQPPSESTSTQRPLLTDAQKNAVAKQRWDEKSDEEKRTIKKSIAVEKYKKRDEYFQNLGSKENQPNVTDLVTSEPTFAEKMRYILANPAGSFGQASRGENIMVGQHQGIDDVTGMLNPVWYMDKLSKGVGDLTRGEFASAGWNFLAGVPAIGPVAKAGLAYKAASKTKKFLSAPKSKIFNQGTKSQYKVTNLDPNLKQAQTFLNPTMTNNFATKIIEGSGKANSQAMYAKELAAKNAIVASMLKGNKNKSSGNSSKDGLGAMPGTFNRSDKIGTKSTYNPYFPKNITSPVVQSQPIAPWQMQDLPGLHLKSTMSTNPKGLHKQVNKKGQINVENALKFIKNNEGEKKSDLIRQALGDNIPKKMDYNDFRKATQKQLIPLERELVNHSSDYGLDAIGYKKPPQIREGFDPIAHIDSNIVGYEYEIARMSTRIEKDWRPSKDRWIYNNPNWDKPQYFKTEAEALAVQKKDIAGVNEKLKQAKLQKEVILKPKPSKTKESPYENQTLILSNKYKFGRGSDAHDNPAETLGHVHFFTGGKNTGIFNVSQIQSDAFQGTNKIHIPKSVNLDKRQKSLKEMEKIADKTDEAWKNAVQLPNGSWKYPNQEQLVSNWLHKQGMQGYHQREINKMYKADTENFSQKQLLAKNHEERFLQEIVDYAAKRGDMNKIRLPTVETAAKIQGYKPISNKGKVFQDYGREDKTILKKYSKQPKRVKKLFGIEPKTVTGEKGNTWYEFDIPESFKKGKAEIKAFSTTGAIGTGALLSQDKPTYRFGGMVEGDPEKPPKKEPWNVPDFTDVTWTNADLDYANKNYCAEDGACLDRSFQGYDKSVASFIPGMPSSSQFKKDYGFQSAPLAQHYIGGRGGYETQDGKVHLLGKDQGTRKNNKGVFVNNNRTDVQVSDKAQKWFENQRGFSVEREDFSVDSWDAAAVFMDEGGIKVFSEQDPKNKLGKRDIWGTKSKEEKMEIYKSLPIGTHIGYGRDKYTLPDSPGYNQQKGYADSNHSAQVVGYNEEGIPIVYDWDEYRLISDHGLFYSEDQVSNIIIPKHSIGKTRDYFAKKNLLKNEEGGPLNLDLTDLYAEGDEGELKPFYETLVEYKKELMPELRIDSKTYDEYAKNLLAIAMQETGGGTSFEHNMFGSTFGETHGLTQLNLKNIIDDPQLKEIAKWYGINEHTDLSNPSNSALASMIYHSRHQKVANQAYNKGRKNNKPLPGVRTYKETKEEYLKDAVRSMQGKKSDYWNSKFKTEEGPYVDLWAGDNDSYVGWKRSVEHVQGQLDEINKGRYKAYKKDGEILINKNTYGNTELTPSERALYSWPGYETLRTGDAQKGSRYFKNVKSWRDLIKDK